MSETWTDKTVFDAKMAEQTKPTPCQHNNTALLEPDIKNVGGIRDINQIGWIAKTSLPCQSYLRFSSLGNLKLEPWKVLLGFAIICIV